MLDHPGQPFEDDALLVRPMRAADPATLARSLAPSLAHSLTHAWIHSTHPWIDEGLAQFMALVWTERTHGRAAALAALQDAAPALALAEPEVPVSAEDRPASLPSSSPTPAPSVSVAGESLAAATGDLFYRTKAAAVWWMLRAIVGDEALKQALQAYRSDARLDLDPEGLERAIEKSSGKDLRWFFSDWVYRDRGLPDLTIAAVTPSQLESRAGLPAGWLVAVEVRNDGYAAAEVPHPRPVERLHPHRLRRQTRPGPGKRWRRPRNPDQHPHLRSGPARTLEVVRIRGLR
jgi:aminopeptidase N